MPAGAERPVGHATAAAKTATSFDGGGSPASARRPGWQKVLWMHQDYEDNYVDRSFLQNLITNCNVRPLQFWDVVRGTVAISQQLSVVVIFNLVFWHTLHQSLSADWVLCLDAALLLLGDPPPFFFQFKCGSPGVQCRRPNA